MATSVLGGGEGTQAGQGPARQGSRGESGQGEARPWLGVQMGQRAEGGVLVKRVFRTSPAEAAGVQGGDTLMVVGGRPVNAPSDVSAELLRRQPGEVLEVVLQRKGNEQKVKVKLEGYPGNDELLRRDRVGVAAPPLEALEAVQGATPVSLEELRGRVVVLDFWASWCTVCRKTAPILNGWYERLGAQGVVVLGVSSDPFAVTSKAINSFGIRYPVAVDKDERVFPAYGASSLPTLYIIDKRGIVREVEVGFSDASMRRVEQLVVALLDEKS